jgi:flagellar motor protein MotB
MKRLDEFISDSANESSFMPMVDALLVILSIFFIGYVILASQETVPPPINIPSDRYFDPSQFILNDPDNFKSALRDSLDKRYQYLKDNDQLKLLDFIIIEGHADASTKRPEYYGIRADFDDGNEELSYFRAFTTYRLMKEIFQEAGIFQGFDHRIIVGGTGSRRLQDTLNPTSARNRRTEIHFIFKNSTESR